MNNFGRPTIKKADSQILLGKLNDLVSKFGSTHKFLDAGCVNSDTLKFTKMNKYQ